MEEEEGPFSLGLINPTGSAGSRGQTALGVSPALFQAQKGLPPTSGPFPPLHWLEGGALSDSLQQSASLVTAGMELGHHSNHLEAAAVGPEPGNPHEGDGQPADGAGGGNWRAPRPLP